MTGSGTASDPYIIMTADDLMSDSGDYVYYKLGADIDFNGTVYARNFTGIHKGFRILDGDGHTIRGIYKNAPTESISLFTRFYSEHYYGASTIKNLKIEAEFIGQDITLFNSTTTSNEVAKIIVENCCFVFNCVETGNSDTSILESQTVDVHFRYSTLILNADIYGVDSLMWKGSFLGCQVRTDVVLHSPSENSNALWHTVAFTDTGCFGSIELKNNDGSSGNVVWAYQGVHSNSYQAIKYKNVNEVYWSSTISTVCFYDSDKNEGVVVKNMLNETNNERIYALTTAQCTDAEYLKSIGYICEGAE